MLDNGVEGSLGDLKGIGGGGDPTFGIVGRGGLLEPGIDGKVDDFGKM